MTLVAPGFFAGALLLNAGPPGPSVVALVAQALTRGAWRVRRVAVPRRHVDRRGGVARGGRRRALRPRRTAARSVRGRDMGKRPLPSVARRRPVTSAGRRNPDRHDAAAVGARSRPACRCRSAFRRSWSSIRRSCRRSTKTPHRLRRLGRTRRRPDRGDGLRRPFPGRGRGSRPAVSRLRARRAADATGERPRHGRGGGGDRHPRLRARPGPTDAE